MLRFPDLESVGKYLLGDGLGDASVVSFDVFDTLLFRRCSPETVQLGVAKDLALSLRKAPADAPALLRERQSAYATAMACHAHLGCDVDAHLDDIHREWATRILPGHAHLREHLAAQATTSKMRYEGWACYANPAAAPLLAELRNRGLTLVYVSDMYLGRKNIDSLLRASGLLGFFDAGYVSGDHAALKSSGRLFRVMLDALSVEPEGVVHIGDNPDADGRGARKAGIRSCIVAGRDPLLAQMRFDQRFTATDRNWHGVCASRFAEPVDTSHDDQVARRIGRGSLGPAFASYVHALAEYSLETRADGVYFLSREGLLLKDLYEALGSVIEPALPPARYLCISRFSAARASMREFGTREVERAMDADATSIRRLLRHLDLDGDAVHRLATKHGFSDSEALVGRGTAGLARLVADAEVQERAALLGAACRHELVEYLRNLRFLDAGRVVLADVGWGGQIPAYLEEALADVPHPTIQSFFMGADANADDRRGSGLRIRAHLWDATQHTWAGSAAFKCVHIIENACRAPHGTIVGHRGGEALVQSEDANERIPELADEPSIALLQAGIRDYMEGYSRYVAMTGAGAADTAAYARTSLARLVYFPRNDELRFLGSLTNVENFGRGESRQLVATPSRARPRRAWRAIRGSLWREGSMVRTAGRMAGLLLSAAREWTSALALPPQAAPESKAGGICLVGSDRAYRHRAAGTFEEAMHARTRELVEVATLTCERSPGRPAMTTLEVLCLQGSHRAIRMVLACARRRRFPSGLLPATPLLQRSCIGLARSIVPRSPSTWPDATARMLYGFARGFGRLFAQKNNLKPGGNECPGD